MLFDYLHLLKNIHNSLLPEKTGELIFDDNGVIRVVKWAHLKQLYHFESERLVKLSGLHFCTSWCDGDWINQLIFLKLYPSLNEKTCKFSDLNEISIAPKPIEKQEFLLALECFQKKTFYAVLTQSGIHPNKNDTVIFINKVLTWWEIFNIKNLQTD